MLLTETKRNGSVTLGIMGFLAMASDWSPRMPLFPAEWLEPAEAEGPAIGRVSAVLTRETFNDMLASGLAASSTTYCEYVQRLAEAIENGSQRVDD